MQPRDLFAERGIKIDQPRDLFAERGINPSSNKSIEQKSSPEKRMFNMTPENYSKFQEVLKTTGSQAQPGFAQGFGNSMIGLANLLPKVNIPKLNFAPNTASSKSGEHLGQAASYFVPGAAFKSIPGVKGTLAGIEQSAPMINAVLKNLGAGTEGALFSAAQAPEGKRGAEAEKGGATASGVNALFQLLGTKNPFINAMARIGLGGGAGYLGAHATGQNPYVGFTSGAGLGLAAPSALARGAEMIGLRQPGMETLEHLSEAEARPAFEAANRLKAPITPGETTGNPDITAQEARFGRTGEAAAERTRLGREAESAQKGAINDLLDTIVDRSTPAAAKASKDKVSNLYKQANTWNLDQNEITQLKNDPVISDAFDAVQKDSAYRRKLQGIPENNFAYLNQVKRALQDMEGKAIKAGENDRAMEFSDARNDLVSKMDTKAPVYKQAREEAQKSIIRNNLQKAMKKKELRGTDFYNTVLKNETEFNKLVEDLTNVPEAQAKLRDMRLAWKNLVNLKKGNTAAHQAETAIDQSRNWASVLIDMWNHLSGAKRNIKALQFIHGGKWDEGFKHIQEIKDANARNDALVDLMEKITSYEAIKK